MIRKIIKQKDSYTITIPINWIRDHNLKRNDEIELIETKESIIIQTEKTQKKESEITIDTDDKNTITYILNNSYRNGIDKLTINTDKQIVTETIENKLSTLLGWHIIKKTNKNIIIDNLSEPDSGKFHPLFLRMFHILSEDLNSVKGSLTSNKDNSDAINKSTNEISMIDNFCRRCISKKTIKEEQIFYYWQLITNLVWVNRSIFYLYKNNKEIKQDKKNSELIELIIESFNEFKKTIFKKDINQISKTLSIISKIEKEKTYFLKSNDFQTTYYLLEISRFIKLLCSSGIGTLL